MDLEHALKKVESGILAAAHQDIFYVDEVNLLDDHVVDVLLDSAAMGVNTIEREGGSFTPPPPAPSGYRGGRLSVIGYQ